MAESTRSKSNTERSEEDMAKLASNQLHVIENLDELIHRVVVLENTSHHLASPSSSSAIPNTIAKGKMGPPFSISFPLSLSLWYTSTQKLCPPLPLFF